MSGQRTIRSGWRRAIAACGVLLGLGLLTTVAAFTQSVTVSMAFADGDQNTFDIDVAGSFDTTWTPGPGDWRQGNPNTAEVLLGDGKAIALAPGQHRDERIAVRNASPKLGAHITLAITDPDPMGTRTGPDGVYLELFDQMVFTLSHRGAVLIDHVPGTEVASLRCTLAELPAGEQLILDLRAELPDSVGDDHNGAGTRITILFTGENS